MVEVEDINDCINCHTKREIVLWHETIRKYFFRCLMCGKIGRRGKTIEEAVECWNKENRG